MIETLFYKCLYSYLLTDKEKTKFFYNLVRDEYAKSGSPDSLKTHQFKELKRIKSAIDTNSFIKSEWIDDDSSIAPEIPTEYVGSTRQKELVKKIDQHKSQLDVVFNDSVQLYNIEHPCPPYGFVDMVYKGENTIYPVEVKKGKGEHDLIGQILKYDLYHKFRLHYHFYDYVQSITICSSYNPYTLKQLKQNGIRTLIYTGIKSGFKLSEV